MGWVLKPGALLHKKVEDSWDRYVYLVEVHKENEVLRREIDQLKLELAFRTEKAASAVRLEKLLEFMPPADWNSTGARVVAHNYGPLGVLNAVIVDKGKLQGIRTNMPVITPDGIIGRTFKVGLNYSTVLLISDPNSRIPVISAESRTPGIVSGQGSDKSLSVHYVHLNAPLADDELLVTSGTAGIYPKGLPVARVSKIKRSDIHLFQLVEAKQLFSVRNREEVLILDSQSSFKPVYISPEGLIKD